LVQQPDSGEIDPGVKAASMNAPSLVSKEAKKLSDNQIRELIVARASGEMERNPSYNY
jgi:hypothetical protein